MEEELLKEMIRDRETQIGMIERKRDEQARKMTRLAENLASIKAERKESKVKQELERDQLNQRHQKILQQYGEQWDIMDMKKQQQGASLHAYTEVMKSMEAPESRDSSYVLRMQAQLCKAMHSMGMSENQLGISNTQSDQIQKFLKDMIAATVEEKSQVELKLMNELMMMDGDRREIEEKHKAMMESFWKEKEQLEIKIEEAGDGNAEEEEEDEEREELMEILTQGREEVSRMETEIAEQKEKISKLRDKLGITEEELAELNGENDDED